ncbi:MAG: hypothetical protein K2N58_08315 [Treponemataceae bacterium]|nr:hypothetical protein [Treponemataceae bacterium]
MKCSCGKKFFEPALFAAALSLALLFGCSSGGDNGLAEIPSQGGTQGGVQNPGSDGNAGGEQTPGQDEEQPGGGENPGSEIVVPPSEYSCEITSVSMSNESISPKSVSEILGALAFDYVLTASTGEIYQGWHASYENFPEEIRNEIRFIEVTEKGDVERDGEYEFPSGQENVAFEIWHGGESKFERTLKNGNYDYSKVLKMIAALLKEIIGESDYDAISAEVAAGGLALTAEKIKAVGDIFPSLEKDAESGKEAKDVENAAAILQNKEAFVAQAQGEVAVRFEPIYPDDYDDYLKYPWNFSEAEINAFAKKYVVTYKANVKFTGTFNLSEISLPANNGKGDFTNATLTNDGESIFLDKINNIRGDSKPTLSFEKNDDNVRYYTPEYNVSERSVYDLYKTYSDDLGKLNIKGDFKEYIIDGKKISGDNNYTLFEEDENTVKKSDNDTIKSLTIDVLIQMYEQLSINKFVNMIISGDSKEQIKVDWILTNMVFEGDMSNIKQTKSRSLTGIVYFEDKPYNNIDRSKSEPGQSVNGLLKLDSLDGVSYNNFGVAFDRRFGVLDVRGVDKTTIESYNYKNYENDGGYGILANHQNAHAIYFSKDFISIKNNQTEVNKLCYKFSKHPDTSAGFFNAYLGNDRVNGESYNENVTNSVIGAKNTRSLKEFEDFGNYFENNYEYKFNKTAKETYKDVWESLSDFDKANLENYLYEIAQNNKRHFSCAAKSIV